MVYRYMFKGCRRSCRKCTPTVADAAVDAAHETLRVRQQQYEEHQRRLKAEKPADTFKPPLPQPSGSEACRDSSLNCADLIERHGCDSEGHKMYGIIEYVLNIKMDNYITTN